jgi:hypothetical protein
MCYDATLVAPAVAALAVAGIGRGQPVLALLGLAAAFEVTAPSMGMPALLVVGAVLIADWRSAPGLDASASAPTAPSAALP